MAETSLQTLDLNFQGRPFSLAAYLIAHNNGVLLVESGPGSTQTVLQQKLQEHGYSVGDVTHVLLTHIHLDHAGAAGWLAEQEAQVVVHPFGAVHLVNPEKLLASATRIYGDRMDVLWGKFLPVPQEQIVTPEDGAVLEIGGLRVDVVHAPGHAEHHLVYRIDGTLFTGDVGGVRIPGTRYLRLPMPPPELHFGRWRATIERLSQMKADRIAPTHFGVYDDPRWHLAEVRKTLDLTESWLEREMASDPPYETLREHFAALMDTQARDAGLDAGTIEAFALANPLDMSITGMQRYWSKTRV
jgi:glyoxylase-like metal-dependent hydrolase (beta-lactamase superfamily II)